MIGRLYIVSTPIGNLEDITLRAIKTLFSVDILLCEDTRKAGQILLYYRKKYLKLMGRNFKAEVQKPKLISYYEENEERRIPEIIGYLKLGKKIAIVSNSGTPAISDPGFKLIKETLKRGIRVIPIPGPSSILAALVASGLPTDKFLFLGYLPIKKNKRLKLLKSISLARPETPLRSTIILFEAPHRLTKLLKELKEIFGDIKIVIARELTKVHEEIWRGKISQAISYFKKPKGEFTILFRQSF